MRQAQLWKSISNDRVQCRLCSHFCIIEPDARGLCGVRENRSGSLITYADTIAALHVDPVEKKPLFHFLPGTLTFSFAAMGCNFSCAWCQNASLSQPPRSGQLPTGQPATPESLVDAAIDRGCRSISYTYSEPTIFYELMLDTARAAHERGLSNILVSNGFQSPECLSALGPYIDAANIDLKAFTEAAYTDFCGARLKPVLENLKHMRRLGWWLEVTTLLVPDVNDSDGEIADMAAFIHDELSPETPWHLSRFHPDYTMMDRPPTPVATLERAIAIGRDAGLQYIYAGNVPGHNTESTICPACGHVVIARHGFSLGAHNTKGLCPSCKHPIPGVFSAE